MLKDTLIAEILKEYAALRANSEKMLRDREFEVYRKVPELADLRNSYQEQMLTALKESILNSSPSNEEESTADVISEKFKIQEAYLFKKHNIPPEYLQPVHNCSKCGDTGYVGSLVREKCHCLSNKIIEKLYEMSDFGELERQNFETFDPNVFPKTSLDESKLNQRQYMLKIREILQQYSAQFPANDKKTVLFTGKTGLGKTFLLNCMSRVIIDKGHPTIRLSAYNLSNRLFSSMFEDIEYNKFLVECLYDADLLIIDDLGTEIQRNNYTSEDLFHILNERLLKNKHTFLSTNLGLADLRERYSDRITSRLFDTKTTMIIRFLGQDVRLRHR